MICRDLWYPLVQVGYFHADIIHFSLASIAFSIILHSFHVPSICIFASHLLSSTLYGSTACHPQSVPQLGTKATPGTVKVIWPDLGQSEECSAALQPAAQADHKLVTSWSQAHLQGWEGGAMLLTR